MMQFTDPRMLPVPCDTPGRPTDWRPELDVQSMEVSREPLVKLQEYGVKTDSYYARSDGANPPYFKRFPYSMEQLYSRKSVAEMLARVNAFLDRYGVELLVLDAYRKIELQKELWNFYYAVGLKTLGEVSEKALQEFTLRYCSDPFHMDPDDPLSVPPHGTGGAVDLTLINKRTGAQLYMGGMFDDPSAFSLTAYYESAGVTEARTAGEPFNEARRNRRLLFWAMVSEGFSNYSFEWWHYDYGDRMWYANRLPQFNFEGVDILYGLATM